MPLRAPNMYGFIFGFQRRVWCPKWTPASSSCFIVTTATDPPFPSVRQGLARRPEATVGCDKPDESPCEHGVRRLYRLIDLTTLGGRRGGSVRRVRCQR